MKVENLKDWPLTLVGVDCRRGELNLVVLRGDGTVFSVEGLRSTSVLSRFLNVVFDYDVERRETFNKTVCSDFFGDALITLKDLPINVPSYISYMQKLEPAFRYSCFLYAALQERHSNCLYILPKHKKYVEYKDV